MLIACLQTSIRLIAFCAPALTVNCPIVLLFRLCAYCVLQTSIRLIAFCASALTVNFQNYFLLFVFAFLFAAEIDSAYFVFALWLFAILRRCAYCSFALNIDSVNGVLCIGVDCCPPDVR